MKTILRKDGITLPLTTPLNPNGFFKVEKKLVREQKFNERLPNNLKNVPVIFHFFTCESPSHEAIKKSLLSKDTNKQNFADMCRLAYMAKRGVDLFTGNNIHISKNNFPANHRGSAPIHYQALEEAEVRNKAAKEMINSIPDFDKYIGNIFNDTMAELKKRNINPKNNDVLIKIVSPTRHKNTIDATRNYLSLNHQLVLIERLQKLAHDSGIKCTFTPASIESLNRTNRTDADPNQRIAQQAYFEGHGIEKGDLVIFADDHIEGGSAAITATNSLKNSGADLLAISCLSIHPLMRSLELDINAKKLLTDIIAEKDPHNHINKMLDEVHISLDSLSNSEALTIIATLINPDEKNFVDRFNTLLTQLTSDKNGNPINIPIPSENNTLSAVLQKPAISPSNFHKIISNTLDTQRYTVQKYLPDDVYIFDWDQTISDESINIFTVCEKSLSDLGFSSDKIKEFVGTSEAFDKKFNAEYGTSKIKTVEHLLRNVEVRNAILSRLPKEEDKQKFSQNYQEYLDKQNVKEIVNTDLYKILRPSFQNHYKGLMNNIVILKDAVQTLQQVFKNNSYLTVLSNRNQKELEGQIESSGVLKTVQFDAVRGDAGKPTSIVAKQMLNIDLGLTKEDLKKVRVHVIGDRDTDMLLVKQLQKDGINADGVLLDIHGITKLSKSDESIKIVNSMKKVAERL